MWVSCAHGEGQMVDPLRRRLRPVAGRRQPGTPAARRLVGGAGPDRPQADLPGVDAYRTWRPEAQAKALELLRDREASTWRPFYCHAAGCDGHPHDDWDWQHARADQHPPRWGDD